MHWIYTAKTCHTWTCNLWGGGLLLCHVFYASTQKSSPRTTGSGSDKTDSHISSVNIFNTSVVLWKQQLLIGGYCIFHCIYWSWQFTLILNAVCSILKLFFVFSKQHFWVSQDLSKMSTALHPVNMQVHRAWSLPLPTHPRLSTSSEVSFIRPLAIVQRPFNCNYNY